jgi:Mg-chelatase subunit ChlD
MKPFIIFGALSLTFGLGCSANSGNGKQGNGGNASGARSSTGAASGSGGSLNLGSGGSLGSLGGTMGPDEPDVSNGECKQQNFVIDSKPADVLLVLDRSASMIENSVASGETRWDAVVPAVTSVITATDASVSWGLKLFPEGEGSECVPESVTDAIPAQIMPGNAATVNAIITSTMATGNGTPTGEAIRRATAYLQSRSATNQFILLATDGDPSCPDDEAEDYAYDAISAAHSAGFPVYVVGVLDPDEDEDKFEVLNKMAELGGTSRSDATSAGDKFYNAYSKDELTAALTAVTGQVVSCVFEFDSKPPDETNISVKVNGEPVAQDSSHGEGWDYTSDQFLGVELFGTACEQIKTGSSNNVDVIFGCKGEPIK